MAGTFTMISVPVCISGALRKAVFMSRVATATKGTIAQQATQNYSINTATVVVSLGQRIIIQVVPAANDRHLSRPSGALHEKMSFDGMSSYFLPDCLSSSSYS